MYQVQGTKMTIASDSITRPQGGGKGWGEKLGLYPYNRPTRIMWLKPTAIEIAKSIYCNVSPAGSFYGLNGKNIKWKKCQLNSGRDTGNGKYEEEGR
ncbi:MAG: hypothetical protein WD426_04185 [Anditalea sp.]